MTLVEARGRIKLYEHGDLRVLCISNFEPMECALGVLVTWLLARLGFALYRSNHYAGFALCGGSIAICMLSVWNTGLRTRLWFSPEALHVRRNIFGFPREASSLALDAIRSLEPQLQRIAGSRNYTLIAMTEGSAFRPADGLTRDEVLLLKDSLNHENPVFTMKAKPGR